MAILYGTQSNGETLPVQVNSFGQLVAQGLPGEQGPQGDPGPPGPVGNLEITQGTFTPSFGSTDATAAGFFTYSIQNGYWTLYGDLLSVSIHLKTTEVGLTSIRGSLAIVDIPSEAWFALANPVSALGIQQISMFLTENYEVYNRPIALWNYGEKRFQFEEHGAPSPFSVPFATLDGLERSVNEVRFTFLGLKEGSVKSFRPAFDQEFLPLPENFPNS